jgi:hypothetical protein
MESRYFIHEHPLIVVEDLNVDGEKEVVCGVCEEPPLGPGYKCSVCNFICHKSCFELAEEIQHPLHPNHTLRIRAPKRSSYCDACAKCCKSCFFYHCNDCDFDLDTRCASRWRVGKDDCHQHVFTPFLKQIQLTCEACGNEGKDSIFLYCSTCLLFIHAKCASLSRTITILDHDHLLTLTYSINQFKEHANILCKLCYEEINTKYAAYYCHKCSFAAHLSCAVKRRVDEDDMNTIIDLATTGSIGHVTGLLSDINRAENESGLPLEIKHFSHQHVLILNYEEVKDDQLCDGCMQLISPPFYSCEQCNYFLHNICAKLPTSARHKFLPFPFTLLSQAPFSDGVFQCGFCGYYRHGFSYNLESDELMIDIQCFAIQETLKHEVHQHPIFLTTTSNRKCSFCEELAAFVCSPCNFALCIRCATFPLASRYKYDEHPLKLTYTTEDKFKEYYCLICEEKRDSKDWFYYCAECDFSAHIQCVLGKYPYIKFGKTYKDEHHQHPFTFVRKTKESPSCEVCGEHFNEVALECTRCKLTVHPRFGDFKKDCLQKLDTHGVK